MTVDRAADLLAACKALCDGPRHRWRLDRVIQCAITLHVEAPQEPVERREASSGVVHGPGSPLARPCPAGDGPAAISERHPPERQVQAELMAKLAASAGRPMTDEEIAAQRASFVRGQLGFGSDRDEAEYRAAQDDFARRYPPAREAQAQAMERGTVMLDSGPVRPTNPAEDAGDMA